MNSTTWTLTMVGALTVAACSAGTTYAQDYDIGVYGPLYSTAPPSNSFINGIPYMPFMGARATPSAPLGSLSLRAVPGSSQVRILKGNPSAQAIKLLIESSTLTIYANGTFNLGGITGRCGVQGQNLVFVANVNGLQIMGTIASSGTPGVARITYLFGDAAARNILAIGVNGRL